MSYMGDEALFWNNIWWEESRYLGSHFIRRWLWQNERP